MTDKQRIKKLEFEVTELKTRLDILEARQPIVVVNSPYLQPPLTPVPVFPQPQVNPLQPSVTWCDAKT